MIKRLDISFTSSVPAFLWAKSSRSRFCIKVYNMNITGYTFFHLFFLSSILSFRIFFSFVCKLSVYFLRIWLRNVYFICSPETLNTAKFQGCFLFSDCLLSLFTDNPSNVLQYSLSLKYSSEAIASIWKFFKLVVFSFLFPC